MVQINRGSIQINCTDLLDLKQPIQQAQGYIQPSVEVGPRNSIIAKTSTTTSTGASTTLYTTLSDKKFYITYLMLAFTKDASCDNTSVSITATIAGASVVLAEMKSQTLTADSRSLVVQLPYPLAIDIGSTITYGATFTVGALSRRATVFGYYLE